MPAHVESQNDPKDRTRTAYRVTGKSFAEVQLAIENIAEAPAVWRANFQIPQRDAFGFIALGQTFTRVP